MKKEREEVVEAQGEAVEGESKRISEEDLVKK